jgi:hypothetical protein
MVDPDGSPWGPAQPSPTIAQCLNGGFALKVRILKVRIMRTLSLVILLTYLISANALAEPMRCLAEQKYLYEEKGKWEKQYGGALLSVEVNQIFGSAKSSTITCKRASGEASVWVADKTCRVIPGKGKSEVLWSDKNVELINCTFPELTYDNDKICIIDCN